MASEFNWKRFWCPRGETFNLGDRGFLSDPLGEWGKQVNPNLVTFESIAKTPCLALLGEPGMGKSWALRYERADAEEAVTREGGMVLELDLRSYASEERLMGSLFGSPEWKNWRRGNCALHVFLDSLDECLLRIDNVASLLADELSKQPVERLKLRIASRTVPWPTILETALIHMFGDAGFKAYELAPLRRIDVEHAAECSSVGDSSAFLSLIETLGVAPLAIKPVTLKFLIDTYLREGNFPTDQVGLYEIGCRALCEESNDSRRGSNRLGRLSPDERLAIASRIAAITQFANRDAVWTGSEADKVLHEDVAMRELVGGIERAPDEITVSTDAIREVLDTGLFSSRGANRIGWAHQTYAEFLAARYCKVREMPIQQIHGLLFHPANRGRRLVPQLSELAAWISVMIPPVLNLVAEFDPEALLGAAVASFSHDQVSLVVESILRHCDSGRSLHLDRHLYWLYRKLNHPTLAQQLRPYLRDSAKSPGVRLVAMDITRACKVEELDSDLVDIALDASENKALRICAAAAAAEIGSCEQRSRLRPFALGEAGDDPDDEMKGAGLTALWPGLITANEIFPLIAQPKQQSLFGVYDSFLDQKFLQNIEIADLPMALEWFSKQQRRSHVAGSIDRLMDGIVRLAWENLDRPGVALRLAAAIQSRVKLYDELMSTSGKNDFGKELQEKHDRRRMLLGALLPQLRINEIGTFLCLGVRLVIQPDVPWLIERLTSGESETSAAVEARLVCLLIDVWAPDQMRNLWYASQLNEILNSECKHFFAPIALDSEQARILREDLRQQNAIAHPKPLVPPPDERIEINLRGIEQGQMEHWLQLTFNLGLEPINTSYVDTWEPNLTEMPGWKAADPRTRERVLAAALRYLNEGNPQNEEWFGTPTITYAAFVGFRALALLLVAGEEKLQAISTETWRKWIPILLRYPYSESHELKLQKRLLQRAYSLVPEEMIERVNQLIDHENEQSGHLFIVNEIECCWDDRMGSAILAKASDPRLKERVIGSLLELLIQHNVKGYQELAESFISVPPPAAGLQRERMLAAIQALIRKAPDAGWAKVWPIISEHIEFGRLIIESISYADLGHAGFVDKLTEAQLGELYLWTVRNYPITERRWGAGAVSPSEAAGMFRDSILEHLKRRSTFAACDAIRHVMQVIPQYAWIGHYLEEAELLARAATWQPVSPHEFLVIALDGTKRLVQDGDQLVKVILESLGRLQSKLCDELPASNDLWNSKKREYWPKDEQDLSDYVVRHLREDLRDRGVIVNREVQIRRGRGDGSGQSTDIHVDAVVPGSKRGCYESIHAIVETKGNWHPELFQAMETQLRGRYLKDNRCKDGIYLVGWFSCTKWADSDPRKKECPRISLSEAKERFSQQAIALSMDGYNISSYVLDVSLT
jgi:hypothetical protein